METRYYIKEVTLNKYIKVGENNSTILCGLEEASSWSEYGSCIDTLIVMGEECVKGIFQIEKLFLLE